MDEIQAPPTRFPEQGQIREDEMIPVLFLQARPIGSPILGIIIPAGIFIVSFCIAWVCYKHFTKKIE